MQYEYNGNLHTYLINCQKMVKELPIVKLGIPDNIILISILAKLSKDYWNVFDNLIMNKENLSPSRDGPRVPVARYPAPVGGYPSHPLRTRQAVPGVMFWQKKHQVPGYPPNYM
jgi:hypothetical protein